MIDWEEVFDGTLTVIKIIIFLSFIGVVSILGVNQTLQYAEAYPVYHVEHNEANYTCVADVTPTQNFEWNFSIDWSNWWQYLIVYLVVGIAFFIIGLFIFGYVPICGCGGCR